MATELASDTLATALVEVTREEDERSQEIAECSKLFKAGPISGTSERAKLDREMHELANAWDELRYVMSSGDEPRLTKCSGRLDDVLKLVTEADNNWRSHKNAGKFGKVKMAYRKICSNLNAHSEMLTILPASSEYVSIFYGTLQTLIKASMNYEKIAQGLTQAVYDINTIAARCLAMRRLYPAAEMGIFIVRLYSRIFKFLKDAMGWYQKKSTARARLSFSENFYDEFETQILKIREIELSMAQCSTLAEGAEIRCTRLQVEEMAADTKAEFRSMMRKFEESRLQEREERRLEREERRLEREAEQGKQRAQIILIEKSKQFDGLLESVSGLSKIGGLATIGRPVIALLQYQAQNSIDSWDQEAKQDATHELEVLDYSDLESPSISSAELEVQQSN
ncbi:hypothetical protein ACMFMG_004202 [Clarireedia jacksonii]